MVTLDVFSRGGQIPKSSRWEYQGLYPLVLPPKVNNQKDLSISLERIEFSYIEKLRVNIRAETQYPN